MGDPIEHVPIEPSSAQETQISSQTEWPANNRAKGSRVDVGRNTDKSEEV